MPAKISKPLKPKTSKKYSNLKTTQKKVLFLVVATFSIAFIAIVAFKTISKPQTKSEPTIYNQETLGLATEVVPTSVPFSNICVNTTPVVMATNTPLPVATNTPVPVATATPTKTPIPTATSTIKPTIAPTATPTKAPILTVTPTPVLTITGITIINPTPTPPIGTTRTVKIRWNTNYATTGKVEYWIGTGTKMVATVTLLDTINNRFEATMNNLTPNTVYKYIITVTKSNGEIKSTATSTFTTPK